MKNLKNQIKIIETFNGYPIILYREAKEPNRKQINNYFDFLTELIMDKQFHIIIDLTEAKPPNADVRNAVKNRFLQLEDYILSYQVYVGSNFLLKIAVKFIGSSMGINNFKLVSTIEEAIDNISDESK